MFFMITEAAVGAGLVLFELVADNASMARALFMAVQHLAANEVPACWHVAPGIQHGIDPEGLTLGGSFLADAFRGFR